MNIRTLLKKYANVRQGLKDLENDETVKRYLAMKVAAEELEKTIKAEIKDNPPDGVIEESGYVLKVIPRREVDTAILEKLLRKTTGKGVLDFPNLAELKVGVATLENFVKAKVVPEESLKAVVNGGFSVRIEEKKLNGK